MNTELTDVESLTLCGFCKQKFNATDHCPKILACKHCFCLKCIETTMITGKELSCVHCWKRQEVDDGAKSLQTHTPVLSLAHHLTTLGFNDIDAKIMDTKPIVPAKNKSNTSSNMCSGHGLQWTLWCHSCQKPLCHMCFLLIEHAGHHVTSYNEAKELFYTEVHSELSAMSKLLQEIQRQSCQQREFQVRVLEACVSLKTCVEGELAITCSTTPDIGEAKEILLHARTALLGLTSPTEIHAAFFNLAGEKQKLEMRYKELALQNKIDEALLRSTVVLDYPALAAIHAADHHRGPLSPGAVSKPGVRQNPFLLLANFCLNQIYSRNHAKKALSPTAPMIRNPPPGVLPRYFFTAEIDQVPVGRFVIETRPDLAPKMSHNFGALCTGEKGHSYRGCSVFQCWEGESIITGDYETNNGRGGRAVFEEGFFMPEETKMAAVRGAVGMRRTQKRHDNLGLVGSQFRVVLQDMRGFSAIFGHVVEGIEVIEKMAACGDITGKTIKSIIITGCGQA